MVLFVVGLIVFLAVHCVSIVNEEWRNRVVETIGEGVWKGLYSIVAIIGLVVLVVGYPDAVSSFGTVYNPPKWLQHLSLLLLLPVFPLLFAAYFPGRIKARVKHPMLIATKVWAFAHLLANGATAHLLLFGSILIWAIVDHISVKKRNPRPVPGFPAGKGNDLISIVAGLGVYLLFLFYLHELLFGVAPF